MAWFEVEMTTTATVTINVKAENTEEAKKIAPFAQSAFLALAERAGYSDFDFEVVSVKEF